MFPKTGRRLLTDSRRVQREKYALLIADVLQFELGDSHHAHKTLMRWTGASERTAKNWLSGSSGPSGEHLLQLLRNSDSVFEAVLKVADRRAFLTSPKLLGLRDSLQTTVSLLSDLIDSQEKSMRH